MKEETSVMKGPPLSLRFLLCDITGNVGDFALANDEWVSSPIQCLDKAVDTDPNFIVIRFGQMPFGECEALVELGIALKRNSHTQKCPILALLHSKHRKLLEDLGQAGVDFVKYVGETALDSTRIRTILEGLGPDDRLDRHLKEVCAYLRYSVVESQHELAACGAYLDRLVLGSRQLNAICKTENHLQCEYFLNPRLKS